MQNFTHFISNHSTERIITRKQRIISTGIAGFKITKLQITKNINQRYSVDARGVTRTLSASYKHDWLKSQTNKN